MTSLTELLSSPPKDADSLTDLPSFRPLGPSTKPVSTNRSNEAADRPSQLARKPSRVASHRTHLPTQPSQTPAAPAATLRQDWQPAPVPGGADQDAGREAAMASRSPRPRRRIKARQRRRRFPYWLTLTLLLVGSSIASAGLKVVYLIYDTEDSLVDRVANAAVGAVVAAFDGVVRLGKGVESAGSGGGGQSPATPAGPSPVVTAGLPASPVSVTPIPVTIVPPPGPSAPRPDAPAISPLPPVVAAPPLVTTPVATPPVVRIDPAVAASLRDRGNELMRSRDIGAARLVFLRAAEAGDVESMVAVGESFDPAFLRRLGVVGFNGDRAQAALWYGRASALGDVDAAALLRSLPPG